MASTLSEHLGMPLDSKGTASVVLDALDDVVLSSCGDPEPIAEGSDGLVMDGIYIECSIAYNRGEVGTRANGQLVADLVPGVDD